MLNFDDDEFIEDMYDSIKSCAWVLAVIVIGTLAGCIYAIYFGGK